MAMLVEPLALATPIAAFNGGVVVEPDLTPVEERVLPAELVPQIVRLLERFGLDVWLYRGSDWLVRNPQVNGIYNLGSGQARTFEDLAKAVFAAAGREPQIEYGAMPPAIRDKYQYFTEAKMDRLRAAGYTAPMTPLEEGIGDYVGRFLSQPDHYR